MKLDTDNLVLTARILHEMRDCSTREGTCLIYPFDHVEARVRGILKTVNVPLGTAVYAMTHAHDHIKPGERVTTTCGNPFCIEEEHQVKVTGERERKKVRAHDTDRLVLNAEIEDMIKSLCEPRGDCLVFTRGKGRHLSVKVLNEIGRVLVSVRRVAYAISHPGERVSEHEDVVIICGNKGDHNTGEGCCMHPDHMVKVPAFHKIPRDVAAKRLRAAPAVAAAAA